MMQPQKKLIAITSLFCGILLQGVLADTLIYNNSTLTGYSFPPGSYYEIFDYGSSTGGRVSKFTFGYYSAATTSLTVRFYQNINITYYDIGYLLKQITISNLPATGGGYRYHEYVLPEADRFTLPNGYFGYSITCTRSDTELVLAKGGTGNQNKLWEYYEDWLYGWGWYPFWFNGTPWAGLYMKIYSGPPIDAITCDITGYKFDDRNANGIRDAGEPLMSGWELYLDTNSDGAYQPSEPNTVTDPNGYYRFENMPSPAIYRVREINKDGWTQTLPGLAANYQYTIATEPNTLYSGYNFGNTTASAKYGGGQGTSTAPYLIYTAEHMNQIGLNTSDWSKYFKLMADIDMSAYTGTQYNIIGSASTKFTGTFDGNGHVIRNLTYSTTTAVMYVGLFGYTSNAAIKNLGIENASLSTGGSYVGGLTAWQEAGSLTDCYSIGTVTASSTSTYVGGLVGRSSGSITRCGSKGTVSSVSTVAAAYAGGLVGLSSGPIIRCSSKGAVSSASTVAAAYAGGLAGFLTSNTLSSSCSTAAVTASSASSAYAGGLVGLQSNCMIFCFSTGPVSASSSTTYAGGLVGFQDSISSMDTDCFWDTQTSGQSTSAAGTGKTTFEMQKQSTFVNAHWDFVNTWRICDGTNYPRLQWQPLPTGDFVCPEGIELADVLFMAESWLMTGTLQADIAPAAPDGQVNFQDFNVISGNWLEGTD